MSSGVLLFAINNETVDYVKQAIYCAKRVKRYLKLPVTVVTNDTDNFQKYPFYSKYVDNIVVTNTPDFENYRTFTQGSLKIRDLWHNSNRVDAYTLTPYDKTLLIDTDFIIANSNLLNLFQSNNDICIGKAYKDFADTVPQVKQGRVSKASIPLYWATVVYFKKSNLAKNIFDLVGFVRDNWSYYRSLFNVTSTKFRNDYAFSIAAHIINGFTESKTVVDLPYTLYNSFDVDIPLSIHNSTIKVLSNNRGDYNLHVMKNTNVHLMNKFELDKIIDKDFANE